VRRSVAARVVVALALGAGSFASVPASSTPLTADSEVPAWAAHSLSASDLVLTDPRRGLSTETPGASPTSRLLGTWQVHPAATGRARPEFEFGLAPDPGGLGGTSHDTVGRLVNVQRGNGTLSGAPARGRRASADDSLGLDLGRATNEWIRDSVREVLTSVLDLNVNERGQASFSFLGMGDFNVTVSGGGSEFALTAGDNVFIAGRRPGESAYGANMTSGGRHADSSWSFGGAPSGNRAAPVTSTGESPLKQALRLALEIAAHPISFLVYALICAYALLWALLSSRTRRRRRVARITHDRPGGRSPAKSPAPALTHEPVAGTTRKRVRVRRRRHRTKPSTHRA
jgi:hypothetical protein